MQRRKIEISKRLHKTSANATNNINGLNKSKINSNIQKEIEQLKLTSTSSAKSSFKNDHKQQINNDTILKSNYSRSSNGAAIFNLDEYACKDQNEIISQDHDVWLQDLSARICQEFLMMQKNHNDSKK
jgi:hypothetical protein